MNVLISTFGVRGDVQPYLRAFRVFAHFRGFVFQTPFRNVFWTFCW